MKLTPGKTEGAQSSLERARRHRRRRYGPAWFTAKIACQRKGGDVTDAMMEEFKTLVTEVLTPHATAILLDPSGDCLRPSVGPKMPDCCSLMKRPDTTRPVPADSVTCSTCGPRAV